jgi:hypothetical protein
MKFWRLVIALAVVFTIAVIAIVVFIPSPEALSRTPSGTNNYAHLIAAAQLIQVAPPREFDDPDVLEASVRTNSAAVLAAREALVKPIWSPPPAPAGDNSRLNDLQELKQLALAMRAEAKLLSLEGRYGDQARLALDLIRMGHAAARGGPLIDALVGLAIESLGVSVLPPVEKVDAGTASHLAADLVRIDDGRTSADTVWSQELAWADKVHGVRGKLVRLVTATSLRRTRHAYAAKHAEAQQLVRMMMASYAARAFELRHGARPQSWSDLIPHFLPTIPLGTNGVPLPFRAPEVEQP